MCESKGNKWLPQKNKLIYINTKDEDVFEHTKCEFTYVYVYSVGVYSGLKALRKDCEL